MVSNENKRSRYKFTGKRSIFSERLESLMMETNTKQQPLAEYIGKTRQTVSLYCDGHSDPTPDTLARIADFFNVSTDWLTGRTDIRSVDADLQTACLTLGMSEKALKSLLKMNEIYLNEEFVGYPSPVKVLDCLLKGTDFYVMLAAFGAYARSVHDNPNGTEQIDHSELSEAFKSIERDARDIEKKTSGLFRVAATQDIIDAEHAKALRHFEHSIDYVARNLYAENEDDNKEVDHDGE